MNKNAVQCIILFFGFECISVRVIVPVLLMVLLPAAASLLGMEMVRDVSLLLGLVWVLGATYFSGKLKEFLPTRIQAALGGGAIVVVMSLLFLMLLYIIMRTS